MKIKYNKIVPKREIDNPDHKANGIELIRRTKWFNNQMIPPTIFPQYNAAIGIEDIATTAIHPQRAAVDSGIAIIFDSKNNNGNWWK